MNDSKKKGLGPWLIIRDLGSEDNDNNNNINHQQQQ